LTKELTSTNNLYNTLKERESECRNQLAKVITQVNNILEEDKKIFITFEESYNGCKRKITKRVGGSMKTFNIDIQKNVKTGEILAYERISFKAHARKRINFIVQLIFYK